MRPDRPATAARACCCWPIPARAAASDGARGGDRRGCAPAAWRVEQAPFGEPEELARAPRGRAGERRQRDRRRRRRQPLPGGARASSRPVSTLGILPTGTANDLARTLGIPPDLDAAAEDHPRRASPAHRPRHRQRQALLQRRLDRALGRSRPRRSTPDLKRRWGRLGYALAALRVLARARRFSAWITENGETTRTRTMQIAVGNGRFYGGGTVVAETPRSTTATSTSTASSSAPSGSWR